MSIIFRKTEEKLIFLFGLCVNMQIMHSNFKGRWWCIEREASHCPVGREPFLLDWLTLAAKAAPFQTKPCLRRVTQPAQAGFICTGTASAVKTPQIWRSRLGRSLALPTTRLEGALRRDRRIRDAIERIPPDKQRPPRISPPLQSVWSRIPRPRHRSNKPYQNR